MLPHDTEAERAVIDSLLHGVTDESLDPSDVFNDGRRGIVLAVDFLRWSGPWRDSASSHPRDVHAAWLANAEIAVNYTMACGAWASVGDLRHELFVEIRHVCGGHPEQIGYWLDRLRTSRKRRDLIAEGEAMIREGMRGETC